MLFLWASNSHDVVRSAVATVDGPLDLTVAELGLAAGAAGRGGGSDARAGVEDRDQPGGASRPGSASVVIAGPGGRVGLPPCGSPETSPDGRPAGTPVPTREPRPPTPTPCGSASETSGLPQGLAISGPEFDWRVPALTFGRLVYSGLYRYDGRDNAIPDLADGPCFVPGADGDGHPLPPRRDDLPRRDAAHRRRRRLHVPGLRSHPSWALRVAHLRRSGSSTRGRSTSSSRRSTRRS